MSLHQAAALRSRAHQLRSLAHTIENTSALQLEQYAGHDTWFGPRPDECRFALSTATRDAQAAAADLRVSAAGLDRQAAAMEATLE